jgi:predicted ATP-binding protein involved in virulence
MLKTIRIEKLFNLFNYTIDLNQNGITILTGPNGYGKTTILRMIHAISTKNPFFFINLRFDKIELIYDKYEPVTITRTDDKGVQIKVGKNRPAVFNKDKLHEELSHILKDTPYRQIENERWLDRRTDMIVSTETLLSKILPEISDFESKVLMDKFPKTPDVYLIREQRLLRRISNRKRRIPGPYYYDEEGMDTFGETIEEYARELKDTITKILAKSSQIAQELDSSFPRRLFDEAQEISEQEFSQRFEKVKEQQKALTKYGLTVIKEDNHPTYKPENAKALLVYLNDSEKKLEVFSEIIKKLDAFTGVLNERRFAFKRIHITKENGFEFITDQKRKLPLTNLSSGEQQEVVLMYELLFKVNPGTLVLIDEPEISLHVAWQKEFLKDLIRIVDLQDINVVIATHSPQVINERWDLTIDLEEIANK